MLGMFLVDLMRPCTATGFWTTMRQLPRSSLSLAREASASNATAFRLVSGPQSLGVRVLATGGHAAALGAAAPNSVVALASTLSCSFRRDVAPASTLLDVALEADELAAVAAELEAAKSGAADGAWALAMWAPAGFADVGGGFCPWILPAQVFFASGL